MRKALLVLTLTTVSLFALSAMAADKVVVIPLGSGAKGTNGQMQYNDGGKTAGAEVYYDKATGQLEVPGEVRTVDGSGNTRLWGQGYRNVNVESIWFNSSINGIQFARSNKVVTAGDITSACPAHTWVCSIEDRGSINVATSFPSDPYISYNCVNGQVLAAGGWLADGLSNNSPTNHNFGFNTSILSTTGLSSCYRVKVWCCRNTP